MSELQKEYKRSGIWSMESPRASCVIPDRPLLISADEERDLNELALAAWNGLEMATEWGNDKVGPTGRAISQAAQMFPESISMPPAVRIDVVRTAEGPRIVEVDPVTAISLGETAFLMSVWSQLGYTVPSGLEEVIVQETMKRGVNSINISLPQSKEYYRSDLSYLARRLGEFGVECSMKLPEDTTRIELSAFNDAPDSRRRINRDGWLPELNPLWGPMIGLSDKTNLDILLATNKSQIARYLPAVFNRDELRCLDDSQIIVAKPLRGGGSKGVQAVTPSEAIMMPEGYVFQELLQPLADQFMDGDSAEWISRISIYASRTGIVGAQVTARPKAGIFTNAHGQADAVQTTIAIEAETALTDMPSLATNR